MQSTTSSWGSSRPARARASAPAAVTPPAVSANTPVSSARKRIPSTSSGSLTAAAHPPVSRIARAANMPSAGLPIARERQMVWGTSGSSASPPRSTRRTSGAHPYEAGAVDAGADDLAGLELVGDEDPCLEARPCRVRRDGVREVAGGRAADGLESEGGGRVDRRGHDAVLEGKRWMGHRVVLHPHPRHAEAPCERRSVDQRREPGVERPYRIAVERQPFLVAPE